MKNLIEIDSETISPIAYSETKATKANSTTNSAQSTSSVKSTAISENIDSGKNKSLESVVNSTSVNRQSDVKHYIVKNGNRIDSVAYNSSGTEANAPDGSIRSATTATPSQNLKPLLKIDPLKFNRTTPSTELPSSTTTVNLMIEGTITSPSSTTVVAALKPIFMNNANNVVLDVANVSSKMENSDIVSVSESVNNLFGTPSTATVTSNVSFWSTTEGNQFSGIKLTPVANNGTFSSIAEGNRFNETKSPSVTSNGSFSSMAEENQINEIRSPLVTSNDSFLSTTEENQFNKIKSATVTSNNSFSLTAEGNQFNEIKYSGSESAAGLGGNDISDSKSVSSTVAKSKDLLEAVSTVVNTSEIISNFIHAANESTVSVENEDSPLANLSSENTNQISSLVNMTTSTTRTISVFAEAVNSSSVDGGGELDSVTDSILANFSSSTTSERTSTTIVNVTSQKQTDEEGKEIFILLKLQDFFFFFFFFFFLLRI